jgi:creatinine amidohydrolase
MRFQETVALALAGHPRHEAAMPLPSRYWIECGWQDFAATDMSKVIAVLPVAAVEQHGPHLPVGVDTHIMQGYLDRTLKLLPTDLSALFLPIQTIGKSNEHLHYPGTLTKASFAPVAGS